MTKLVQKDISSESTSFEKLAHNLHLSSHTNSSVSCQPLSVDSEKQSESDISESGLLKSSLSESSPYAIKSGISFTQDIDYLIQEERIAFYLNGVKLLSVMSIPKDQEAHIVGFLMSEGVLDSIHSIRSLEVAQDGLSVFLEAHIDEKRLAHLHKEKTLTSGCCVGVSGNFDGEIIEKFLSSPLRVKAGRLFGLLDEFSQPSELFTLTGCVHKAMLVIEPNKLDSEMLISEDVGRHNAIDKVVGRARLKGLDLSNAALFVSGRLSMEMVIKAAMNDIPLVISRAASTLQGVKSAQILGVTLIGFARGKGLNIYTHPARIIE